MTSPLSTGDEVQQRKWAGYFDTLQRIVPSPDALISNGDQINDNSFNSAAVHRFPRAMLEQNLARTGMSDTQVMMTFGNHDDYVTRMAEQYPEEWFPGPGRLRERHWRVSGVCRQHGVVEHDASGVAVRSPL